MDVLSYWNPGLDESEFQQGDLSAPFWAAFMDFVRLCHAVKHWGAEKTEARRMARSVKNGGWEKSAHADENHEMRARYLAAEAAWHLGSLIETDVDRRVALRIVDLTKLTPNIRSHETAQFSLLAIQGFDGSL
ncbi:hypothetical protein LA6_001168 [Marinibacterium anthonyi]|nr:hypothetical protein LA6_001168 [Marinibacterium anthonyi]